MAEMATKSIHTLDARDHGMLEVTRDYFSLTPEHMFREIQGLRHVVEKALAAKGISYDALKSALVPDRKRQDIALIFDTTAIVSYAYGDDVFERVIPLFNKTSDHSVLVGDYLDRPGQADLVLDAFLDAVQPRRRFKFLHPTQFYVVYINNLTDEMVQRFEEGLADYEAYVGFADMTYMSLFKILLSTMLVNAFVKHGEIVIQGHEPDRPNEEDVNMCGYPFEENGYVCRSISDDLMGVLLSYKIERPVFRGFESDTHFALNAVSTSPLSLDDFSIEVEEAKLGYLKTAKAGSLERAGLAGVSNAGLAEIIRQKVVQSYIYNMTYLAEHNVTKFNVMLELLNPETGKPTRLLAALEYRAEEKVLRLITLF